MEHFILEAQHSGSISHVHLVSLAPHVARDLRIAVTVVAAAWVAVTAIKQLGAQANATATHDGPTAGTNT
ncbi:hypothetical protein CDD81_1390 [Ophiocordyceps australis]|uniref:Uncharacterized protein n=1 Tax=Ophiocordyceps australis TaxID=1399860 RepID=A0A2C5X834_9HYPO|nr:hypothetical protein CDD81_1390 [Ophiocordyceps australis]